MVKLDNGTLNFQHFTFYKTVRSTIFLCFFLSSISLYIVLLFTKIINGDAYRNHCAHRNTKDFFPVKVKSRFCHREK